MNINEPQYYWKIAEDYIKEKSKELLINDEYYIDEKIAMKYIKFGSLLRHTAGEFAGITFQWQIWQIHAIIDIFGTKYKNGKFKGLRRYQRVLFFTPKKAGKTEFGALINACVFFLDKEKGKEIYSIASEINQAKILHKAFTTMIRQEPQLESLVKTTIQPPKVSMVKGAFVEEYEALSSTADTKDGKKPSMVLYDETHTYKNKDLYQIMIDGMASRQEPLEIHMSTAGYNKERFFYRDIYMYAKKLRDGIIKDDRFYYVMFEPDEEDIKNDDWDNPKVWEKCNPNLGNSPTWSYMEGKVAQARESEESLIAFKTKHLNWWCDKAETWIDSRVWNNEEIFDLEDYRGYNCYVGVDLSSISDLTCVTFMFKDRDYLKIHQMYFIPGDNVRKRVKNDRVPYFDWIKQGYITTTDGNVIDFEYIEKYIIDFTEKYDLCIDNLGYDQWNANYLITRLEKEEIETVPIRQGFATLSPASKELEVKAIQKKIIHNNNPVLAWCMSNVVLEKDAAGNIKPSKKISIEKIDGVASLINCMALYIIDKEDEDDELIYNERGLLTI